MSDNEKKESDFSGCRVLVVDDTMIQRELLQGLVEAFGAECDTAADANEAFLKYSHSPESHYGLILTDIFMPPGDDGFTLACKIRESGRADAALVPIMGISADTDPELCDRAISVGMNGMTIKPISAATLEAYMTLMLKGSRLNTVFTARLQNRIESERRTKEFLRDVNRHLRAPLNAIMGFARLLQMDGVSDEDRCNWAEAIVNACESASKLLNDTEIQFNDRN